VSANSLQRPFYELEYLRRISFYVWQLTALYQFIRALILYRRRRFINHLLTYLLTYLVIPKKQRRTLMTSGETVQKRFTMVLFTVNSNDFS